MVMKVEIIWDESVQDWKHRQNLSDQRIAEAVREAAGHRGFYNGQIGVRLTDDETIHVLNARHLSHDYPTDVISFPYEASGGTLEGELVASVETAEENAKDAGWDASNELLLYVIHGVLHIGGMDDHQSEDRAAMRRSETQVLGAIGISPSESQGESTEIGDVTRESAMEETS